MGQKERVGAAGGGRRIRETAAYGKNKACHVGRKKYGWKRKRI